MNICIFQEILYTLSCDKTSNLELAARIVQSYCPIFIMVHKQILGQLVNLIFFLLSMVIV